MHQSIIGCEVFVANVDFVVEVTLMLITLKATNAIDDIASLAPFQVGYDTLGKG
jgi:hypothetical protein